VTEKQHGTADVTLVALVSNFYGEGPTTCWSGSRGRPGSTARWSSSASRARRRRTPPIRRRRRGPACGCATGTRRRTAATTSGTPRRFFEKALSDEVEVGVFERAELNDWQPV